MKKFIHCCKQLGICPEHADIAVNPLKVALRYHFDTGVSGDYRVKGIRHCLQKRMGFTSEVNTVFNFMGWIRVKCPKCGKLLKNCGNGGGAGNRFTSDWVCKKCGVSVGLTVPNDAVRVTFKDLVAKKKG